MPTSFASNLDEELAQVSALFSPRVMAVANGQYVRLARVKGTFVWHSHGDEDEFFLQRKGKLVTRDRADAGRGEDDVHVVPRGVAHTTAAPKQCWVVEPAGARHTGASEHAITTSIEPQLAHLRAPHQPTRPQEIPAQWPSKS